MVSSNITTICPSYVFTLEDQSGNQPDITIFDFDESSFTLTTSSTDLKQKATYPLRLFVRYDGFEDHYTQFGELDFEIILDNPCLDAELSI